MSHSHRTEWKRRKYGQRYFTNIVSTIIITTDILILIKTPQHQLLGNINGYSNNSTNGRGTVSNPTSGRGGRRVRQRRPRLNIKCVFCQDDDMKYGFYQHPYVPKKFHYQREQTPGIIIIIIIITIIIIIKLETNNIYMCIDCIEKWQVFRVNAIAANELTINDENNIVKESLCR